MRFPKDRVFRGQRVVVTRLLPEIITCSDDLIVRDVAFEDCHLLGPAVVNLKDVAMTLCNFFTGSEGQGRCESILWEPPHAPSAIGCMGFADARFDHCTFEQIGFTGSPEMLDHFRRDVLDDRQ